MLRLARAALQIEEHIPHEGHSGLTTSEATPDLSLTQLEDAASVVLRYIPPTSQYCWPLLSQQLGCEVWVKHENHTPVGAFKLRGGIYYLSQQQHQLPKAFVAATRGNHG